MSSPSPVSPQVGGRRLQILRKVRDRLAVIRVADGFASDAGLNIFMGEAPTLGDGDPDVVLVIGISGGNVSSCKENVVEPLPFEIVIVTKADLSEPLMTIEAALADIKTAVELGPDADPTRDFNGLAIKYSFERVETKTYTRADGSGFVGAGIAYRVLVAEKWGNP